MSKYLSPWTDIKFIISSILHILFLFLFPPFANWLDIKCVPVFMVMKFSTRGHPRRLKIYNLGILNEWVAVRLKLLRFGKSLRTTIESRKSVMSLSLVSKVSSPLTSSSTMPSNNLHFDICNVLSFWRFSKTENAKTVENPQFSTSTSFKTGIWQSYLALSRKLLRFGKSVRITELSWTSVIVFFSMPKA